MISRAASRGLVQDLPVVNREKLELGLVFEQVVGLPKVVFVELDHALVLRVGGLIPSLEHLLLRGKNLAQVSRWMKNTL